MKIKVTCACGDGVTEKEKLANELEVRLRYAFNGYTALDGEEDNYFGRVEHRRVQP